MFFSLKSTSINVNDFNVTLIYDRMSAALNQWLYKRRIEKTTGQYREDPTDYRENPTELSHLQYKLSSSLTLLIFCFKNC